MSYRTLLFALPDAPLAPAHVDFAAQLANAMDARLVGLGCLRPNGWPTAQAPTFIEGDPLTVDWRAAEDAAVAREQVFLQRCHLAGVRSHQAILESAELVAALCRHAFHADLVVMAQPPAAGPHHAERRRGTHVVLQESIRPVLLLPEAGRLAARAGVALLAWDGSAGAARAAAAAVPLMQLAKVVHVVQVVDARHADHRAETSALQDVSPWLAGHGIDSLARIVRTEAAPAQALLAEAAATSAELIVMGAWGHRRLVERLVGGATSTMVDRMTVPVLFAH